MKSFVDRSPAKHRQQSNQEIESRRTDGAKRQLTDNRGEALAQRQMAETIHNGPQQAAQRRQIDGLQGQSAQARVKVENSPLQRMESDDKESFQRRFDNQPVQRVAESQPNRTGLPDNLKVGIETLSGYSMDAVKVHYNSSKPAQIQAHAYAQGNDIHLASGQEKHLPHEAWHVVQQRQGRVRPTTQMAGVQVNDDEGLENEADVMGTRANAAQRKAKAVPKSGSVADVATRKGIVQEKIKFKSGEEYAKRLDLKGTLTNTQRRNSTWIDRVTTGRTYLAKSPAELRKYADRTGGALLTPHRHLIGENHAQSQFTKALADWGWAADKMAESYNESSVVTDKVAKSNREFKGRGGGYITSNPYYQTKALEKYHPYIIQGLSMLRFSLTKLRDGTRAMQNQATNIVFAPSNYRKQQFTNSESSIIAYRDEPKDLWNGFVKPHIPSYQEACNVRIQTPRGVGNSPTDRLYDMATAMAPHWASMGTSLSTITTKPYWKLSSWIATSDALRDQAQQIDQFILNVIDVWMDHLVLLTKAEAAEMTRDTRHDRTIDQSLNAGRAATTAAAAVRSIGPMREIFMANNINNNLNLPGLVQIGAEHVDNLKGKISEGKYYASYAKFKAATES